MPPLGGGMGSIIIPCQVSLVRAGGHDFVCYQVFFY